MSDPRDETLVSIRRCLAGEETAFASLFDQYKNLVYRTAYLMLDSRDDAEEALQEVFLQVHRSLSTYRAEKAAFSTWLHRITINHCLNRKRKAQVFAVPLEWTSPADLVRGAAMENRAADDDALRQGLSRLKSDLRAVIVLRYFWDLPYKDIALILGVPPGTIKSRMDRALKTLRKELESSETGLDCAALPGQSSPQNVGRAGGRLKSPVEKEAVE